MDPSHEVPKRSNFWFGLKSQANWEGKLFDRITIVFTVFLTVFSFIVLWPVVSKINFEEVFFVPLIPFLKEVLSLLGIGAQESIRMLFMASFVASTVGVYLLVRELTKRQMTSILAASVYMMPPVPIFVLTFLKRGLTSFELGSAKSFLTVMYGDGGFLALAIIPFAVIFFLRFLKKGKYEDMTWAVFLCVATMLTNQPQSLSLLLIFGVVAVSEFFLGQARLKLRRFFLVLILSLGLVSFWYVPMVAASPLLAFESEAVRNLKYLFPLPFIIGTLSLVFSFVFFGRKETRQGVFVFFLLFLVFISFTAGWLFQERSYVAHPYRLVADLNMFGAVVVALSLTALLDKLRLTEKFGFETWPLPQKILCALVFGAVSFAALVVVGFVSSPVIVKAISGPYGIWTKIRLNVIDDKQASLALAGKNFQLVDRNVVEWGLWAGFILTLVFLVILLVMLFGNFLYSEAEREQ